MPSPTCERKRRLGPVRVSVGGSYSMTPGLDKIDNVEKTQQASWRTKTRTDASRNRALGQRIQLAFKYTCSLRGPHPKIE